MVAARFAVPVPEGISAVDAAPLTCAGVTTYKALKVAHIVPTERVAVFGIGGLGHLAVQYGRIMGGSVIAVDIEDAKLDLARELGAEHVVNAAKVDPVAAIQELGGADVALVLAASPRVFEQAFDSLARGGRLVCVALPADQQMTVSIFDTVIKGLSIIGSIVGTRQDRRCSPCTPPGARGSSPSRARSSRSTRRSTRCCPVRCSRASCSSTEPLEPQAHGPRPRSRGEARRFR